MNAEIVDLDITWAIMTYMTDQRFIKAQIQNSISTDGRAEKEEAVNRLLRSVSQLERKLERAVEFSLENPEFIVKVKTLRAEIGTERVKLLTAQSELAAHLAPKDITKLAKEIKEQFWGFDEWPMATQKRVLAEHIERIVIDDEGDASLTVRGGLPAPIEGVGLFDRIIEQIDEDLAEIRLETTLNNLNPKGRKRAANVVDTAVAKTASRTCTDSSPPPA